MGRLDDKVAAVTGGASGIGEATVRRFVAEGASVAFCDRDGEPGQRVAAELETAGAKVAFTQADVGTEAACLAFVNGAPQKFGRLDILVNNAGIRKYEKVEETSAASWKRDPQRQPDELHLLCQGGGSADARQQGRRHR
jgi:2-hydroxycyclohexanecarboxyl-CoA dehydrogenase